jgi:hypothetical protein
MKTTSKNLKLGIKANPISGLLNSMRLLLFAMGITTNAQQIETNRLLNNWHLDTYVISGKKYAPNKKEKEDFMLFNDDMSFISKSEGKQENGIYIFNRNGAYIVMTDENGETLKANIISLTKKHLVLTFDIDKMSAIEVHYNSTIKDIKDERN